MEENNAPILEPSKRTLGFLEMDLDSFSSNFEMDLDQFSVDCGC